MAKRDFLPQGQTEFIAWHDIYMNAANNLSGTITITAGELADINTRNGDLHTKMLATQTAAAAAKSATADFMTTITVSQSAERINARRFATQTAAAAAQSATADFMTAITVSRSAERINARRFRLDPNYTVAIGKQLGIEAPQDTTDMTTAKPVLTVTALPHGCASIDFNKMKADGVLIHSQREGDAGYIQVALESFAPYVDNRPLLVPGKPELRKYKAMFVVGHDEIGLESDVVEAACRP